MCQLNRNVFGSFAFFKRLLLTKRYFSHRIKTSVPDFSIIDKETSVMNREIFSTEIKPSLFGNPMPEGKFKKARRKILGKARHYGYDKDRFYPLSSIENKSLGNILGIQNIVLGQNGNKIDPHNGVLIGSLKMGYGHYRMSIAAASAAYSMGLTPYWFDLLSFDTEGSRMIEDLEGYYNIGSHLADRFRWFRRLVWEPLTSHIYKPLDRNIYIYEMCHLLTNIYQDLPKEMPFIGSHAWTTQAAVFAGFQNVINMVYDNCPHGFHLTDGALHAVQTPGAYLGFRTFKDMGHRGKILNPMPLDQIKMTGHYVDHELVENIEADTQKRMERVASGSTRRILLSIGGTGAQRKTVEHIVRFLLPFVRENKIFLMLNFGTHTQIWKEVCKSLPELREAAITHRNWNETQSFFNEIYTGDSSGVHVFLNDDIFPAVYTTNLLMRAADFLVTKPGELAFYPVPKIFIQRIGGHEAWAAIRGAEIGDGTSEIQRPEELEQLFKMIIKENDLLSLYCDNIVNLKKSGTYNGAYRVIEMALEQKARKG